MYTSIFLFIGAAELIFIALAVVMLFGADKIPEVARGLGKAINQVRNATDEIKSEITRSVDKDDSLKEVTKTIEEGKRTFDEISGTIKRGLK